MNLKTVVTITKPVQVHVKKKKYREDSENEKNARREKSKTRELRFYSQQNTAVAFTYNVEKKKKRESTLFVSPCLQEKKSKLYVSHSVWQK